MILVKPGALRDAMLSRKDLINDLGFAYLNGVQATIDAVKRAPDGSTIRLVSYHGRTVLGHLKDMLENAETRDLRYKILILSPNGGNELFEGATERNLRASLQLGYRNLLKQKALLPGSKFHDHFDIRCYGVAPEEGLFRGCIITDSGGEIFNVTASCWDFRNDRANYGEALRVSGKSNLAELFLQRFDDVFNKSCPLHGKVRRLWWIALQISPEGRAASIIFLIALSVLVSGRGDGDSTWAAIGAFVTFLFAAFRPLTRLLAESDTTLGRLVVSRLK